MLPAIRDWKVRVRSNDSPKDSSAQHVGAQQVDLTHKILKETYDSNVIETADRSVNVSVRRNVLAYLGNIVAKLGNLLA